MKDAELIGIPYIVVFGKKTVDGLCELTIRKTNQTIEMGIDKLQDFLRDSLNK